MSKPVKISLFAAVAFLATASAAFAEQRFDANAFQQAQAAGKTIVIDVYAEWCSTCREQRPIVAGLEKEKPGMVVYEVDYDAAKDVLKRFRVQYQSTLIVFKGTKEVGRSIGETDPGRIRALVEKGL
jgi:thioredoxin 1